jgi:hypothetical protein
MLLSLLLALDDPGERSLERDLLALGEAFLRRASRSAGSCFNSSGCCPLLGGGLKDLFEVYAYFKRS